MIIIILISSNNLLKYNLFLKFFNITVGDYGEKISTSYKKYLKYKTKYLKLKHN